MKKISLFLAAVMMCAVILFTAGCSTAKIDELNATIDQLEAELEKYTKAVENAFIDENKIPYGDHLWTNSYYTEGPEGAASVERDGDIQDSPYFKTLDFYNMKSTDTLILLEGYKTIQQATEWTCGPTAALTVLEWYGKRNGMNELDLAALRHKALGGATNLRQMIYIFEELNAINTDYQWEIFSTYDLAGVALDTTVKKSAPYITEDMLIENLLNGIPTLIGWDDWGGHWTVVIGYDTMGTETTADDVLIIADPYDTTDHCQDGYVIQSFERLFYNWKNTFDPVFSKNVFLTVKPVNK